MNRPAAHGAHAVGPKEASVSQAEVAEDTQGGRLGVGGEVGALCGSNNNLSTPHGAHTPPFSLVYPGLYWKDVIKVLSVREVVLPRQKRARFRTRGGLEQAGRALCARTSAVAREVCSARAVVDVGGAP